MATARLKHSRQRIAWQDAAHKFIDTLFNIITVTYSGAYAYHTIDPISKIVAAQGDEHHLIEALSEFRNLKAEELEFVAKAATLSGAAVIGVFSWPTTEKAIWVAKMLWNWSFFMSCFALINSAHQRLLRHLPKSKDDPNFHKADSDEKLLIALNLFFQPPAKPSDEVGPRRESMRMRWVWQCPTMLMNYSWVFFLVGYALHLMTPIFDPSQAEISKQVAIIIVCGCALVVANFAFCAGLCQLRLTKGTNTTRNLVTRMLQPVRSETRTKELSSVDEDT